MTPGRPSAIFAHIDGSGCLPRIGTDADTSETGSQRTASLLMVFVSVTGAAFCDGVPVPLAFAAGKSRVLGRWQRPSFKAERAI